VTPIARRSLRTNLFLLALAAIGLTLGGWAIGEIMRLQPCPLCIFQRLLFLLIALLALSDQGAPAYDHSIASALAGMGAPAFACTPELFPDLMAAAIERRDLGQWAAARGIVTAGPA